MSEAVYKRNLASARGPASEAKQMAKTATTMAKAATPVGAATLLKYVNLANDLAFIPAIFAAVIKDILDFIGVGSLPAIGTVITICISIFIGFMMLLAGARGKNGIAKGMMKRLMVLGGGTMAEMLFGLNFFPIETAVVILIYFMVLAERKQEAQSGITEFY
jgi:hypothetical protein